MDFLNLHTLVIVCPLIFLAGLVDSVAGGGGLISLPAYLVAGLPMHNALATNKLSSAVGTSISTIRYCKNKFADYKTAVPSIIAALIGSTLGTNLALHTDETILRYIMLAAIPLVAIVVIFRKETPENAINSLPVKVVIVICAFGSLLIGIYDGFYGPGTGTFLLLIYTMTAKMAVRTASGNVKLVNLSSNIAALVTWLLGGKIIIALGLICAAFCMAGHYVGSGLVMHNGTKVVRPMMLVVLALLFIKVAFGS